MPQLKTKSGIEWNFDLEGQGEPLLFLHGWSVDRRIWRQQEKHFVNKYKVLAIDLPGHGGSSWKRSQLPEMVHDIKEILDAAKLPQITVVASSLGGMFGLKLYELYPQIVKRMSFVGSMPKFSKSDDYPHGIDVKHIRKLSGQLDTAYPSIVDIFFRSLFTKEERQSRRFHWLQIFRRAQMAPMKQALSEYLDVLEQEDLRLVLPKVKVPMQFINGVEDPICTMQTISYLQKICPQARFDFFEHCGHFPFLSKPHEYNKILEEFLNSKSEILNKS